MGFYYLQSRYYDPSIGRFVNADGQFEADLTTGLNLFAYCGNDPVNKIDPDGHFALSITAITAVAVVAVAAIAATVYASKQIEQAPPISLSQSISRLEDNLRAYSVYKLVDTTNNSVVYIGRTKNPAAREGAHKHNEYRKELKFQVIENNLTYVEARWLEQAYMLYYHTINKENPANNQINGISPRNSKLSIYAESAMAYLDNQLSNYFLNWIGI